MSVCGRLFVERMKLAQNRRDGEGKGIRTPNILSGVAVFKFSLLNSRPGSLRKDSGSCLGCLSDEALVVLKLQNLINLAHSSVLILGVLKSPDLQEMSTGDSVWVIRKVRDDPVKEGNRELRI